MKNLRAILTSTVVMASLVASVPAKLYSEGSYLKRLSSIYPVVAGDDISFHVDSLSDLTKVESRELVDGFKPIIDDNDAGEDVSSLRKRGDNVDRKQPDRNERIDFKLLPACYKYCLDKFNFKGNGAWNIFTVPIKNLCDYPSGAIWNAWIEASPNSCLEGRCSTSDGDQGRDWYAKSCGR